MRPRLVGLIVLLILVVTGQAPAIAAPPRRLKANQVAIIPLWGPIDRKATAELSRKLRNASTVGASTVVLDIDTPGGDVTAVETVAQIMDAYPKMEFYAYVSGQYHKGAWNAGAFAALLTRKIYMAPGTTFSTARTLLTLQGASRSLAHRLHAVQQAKIRARTEEHGHPRSVVEAMILTDAEFWLVQTDEGPRGLSGAEYRALPRQRSMDDRQLKRKGAALSLTARDAEAVGLATVLEAKDLPAELGVLPREEGNFNWAWTTARKTKAAAQRRILSAEKRLRLGLEILQELQKEVEPKLQTVSEASSRNELAEARSALRQLVKLCDLLVELTEEYPHFGLRPADLEHIRETAEARLKAVELYAKLRPNVKDSEYAGRQNEYGFQPIYTFEAENHIADRRGKKQRDAAASKNYAVSVLGGAKGTTAVKVRPGGLSEKLCVARFVLKVIAKSPFGSVKLMVSCGGGSGSLTLTDDELRRREGISNYADYDVAFSPGRNPIILSVNAEQMHIRIDRIEVWRRADLYPPVIREEVIEKKPE